MSAPNQFDLRIRQDSDGSQAGRRRSVLDDLPPKSGLGDVHGPGAELQQVAMKPAFIQLAEVQVPLLGGRRQVVDVVKRPLDGV